MMSDDLFGRFEKVISSSFDERYRFFELDVGCHNALSWIGVYLKVKKIPHRWAPDLPLHPDACLLEGSGQLYHWLDFRSNPTDGLSIFCHVPYGLLAIGKDLKKPRIILQLIQTRNPNPSDPSHHIIALAAVTAEAELLSLMRDMEKWTVTQRRLRAIRKFTYIHGRSLPRERDIPWDRAILPQDLLDDIRRNVTAFFSRADFFKNNGLPYKRGFLLAGPPGNGKTLLCRIIASQNAVPFFCISGKAECMGAEIQAAFHDASQLAPCILCFEDLDRLFANYHGPSNLGMLLNMMDGLVQPEGVLMIGTTNRPEKIDPVLTSRPSRFDRVWLISDPAEPERRRMLDQRMGKLLDAQTIDRLVTGTEGMSMAFVQELCIGASLLALDRGKACVTAEDAEETLVRLKTHLQLVKKQFNKRRAEEAESATVGAGED